MLKGYNNKYRIEELLDNLTKKEYSIAKNWLPKKLEISSRQFSNWMKIEKDSKTQIPGDSLIQIASFFGVPVEKLYNQEPEKIDLEFQKELKKKKNLHDLI